MKNKLADLNNHLFLELDLIEEIKRSERETKNDNVD